jgi:retron-type reverse transcriptase
MKTYRNLYPRICEFAHLYGAYRRARKGKRDRVAVGAFEFDLEQNLLALRRGLRKQSYRPGPYHNLYIREPKRRLVGASPFRDRVVHHGL